MNYSRTVAAIGALILATTSCGTEMNGHPTPEASSTTPTSTADPATLFDPCKSIPAEFMRGQGLSVNAGIGKPFDNKSIDGKVDWHGCTWFMSEGYSVSIATTNLTLAQIKAEKFNDYKEISIAGRPSVTYRDQPNYGDANCLVNIELGAGSVDFDVLNEPSRKKTGDMDTCSITREMATKVAAFFPAQ
jgi:hypothetical protein